MPKSCPGSRAGRQWPAWRGAQNTFLGERGTSGARGRSNPKCCAGVLNHGREMAQTKTVHQNILLVEDDVIVRLCIAEHLRDCGFVVLEASGSKEARTI